MLLGLGAPGVTLARNDATAVQLALTGGYPQGLAVALRARAHSDHPIHLWPPQPNAQADDLRFGIQWPDGRRVEAGTAGSLPAAGRDGFSLMPGGDGGVGRSRCFTWAPTGFRAAG